MRHPEYEWHKPAYKLNGGIVSVLLGDHIITNGVYNVRWSDGHNEALRVKMVAEGPAVIPHLEITYHGRKLLVGIPDTIEMKRIK